MAILRTSVGVCVVLLGMAAPVGVAAWQRARMRNVSTVRAGVLYRSAQLSVTALDHVVRDHGIRTVVSLRFGVSETDRAEEQYCRDHGLNFVRITPRDWDGVQGSAAIDGGLALFLDTLREPKNLPALVHCYKGVHRTGQYVAAYRVEYEGWSVPDALKEMVERGYDLLDKHDDVRGYFASYKRTGRYALLDGRAPRRVP